MRLEVSATRMELLRLKKRLVMAKRGYKLLKDKQDELMRHFLEKVEDYKSLRENVEKSLMLLYRYYLLVLGENGIKVLRVALMSEGVLEVKEDIRNILNVRVPEFSAEAINPAFYGFFNISVDLDVASKMLNNVFSDMLKLAGIEKTIELLSGEIEKTRRRVNALEYVLIPNIEETIKYITMRLSEIERSTLTRLMKVKEIVRQH